MTGFMPILGVFTFFVMLWLIMSSTWLKNRNAIRNILFLYLIMSLSFSIEKVLDNDIGGRELIGFMIFGLAIFAFLKPYQVMKRKISTFYTYSEYKDYLEDMDKNTLSNRLPMYLIKLLIIVAIIFAIFLKINGHDGTLT